MRHKRSEFTRTEWRRAIEAFLQGQRELESLPDEIVKLESERILLAAALAEPGSFAGDRAAFDASLQRHQRVATDLAAAEEHWLALAAREEALARGRSG